MVKYQAILVKTNGEIQEITPENGKDFQLKQLYSCINCDIIEIVPISNNEYMIVDEIGALKEDKVVNEIATAIYKTTRMPSEDFNQLLKKYEEMGFAVMNLSEGDPIIYGNVVICNKKQFK
jgi:hypothetical protein